MSKQHLDIQNLIICGRVDWPLSNVLCIVFVKCSWFYYPIFYVSITKHIQPLVKWAFVIPHIGRSPADIADWVIHRWPCILVRFLIGSGVADTHFKNGKTMLVECVATSVGSQSCTNRLGMGRLPEIGRSLADDRPIIVRWSDGTIIGDIGLFLSWLGDAPSRQTVDQCPADVHDVRAGIARLPVDASTIEKIGSASEMF